MEKSFFLRLLLGAAGWLIWKAYLEPLSEIFNQSEEGVEVMDNTDSIQSVIDNVIRLMGAEGYFKQTVSADRKRVTLWERRQDRSGVMLIVGLELGNLSTIVFVPDEIPMYSVVRNIQELQELVRWQTEDLVCDRVASVVNLQYLHAKINFPR